MFGYFSSFYPLVMVLQGFCLYHAYKNNNQQKWYWLIIFVPLIGSLIYLYENFYNRRNIDDFSEGLKGLFNANYNIEKLEKEVRFSATVNNKIALADAYTDRGRYREALDLYNSCTIGFNQENPDLLRKMLRVYFLNKNYENAVEIGRKLETVKSFQHSDERIAYAWALHFSGATEAAEDHFKAMDVRFSNFPHRLEYARFLQATARKSDACALLSEMIDEYENMETYERSLKRPVVVTARSLRAQWRK